jgi:hypothetical protein
MNDLASLVARHRDADSPTLEINWALLRLLDRGSCQQLQVDLQAEGEPWEVMTATERTWEAVPAESGLYMFVWRPWFTFDVAERRRPGDLGQVLYIGKAGADDNGQPTSGNLRLRYRDYLKHLRNDPDVLWSRTEPHTRPQLLDRYLTLRPLEYWFTVVPRHSEVPLLEDRLIKLLNPPCNKQRAPRLKGRLGPPRPAF